MLILSVRMTIVPASDDASRESKWLEKRLPHISIEGEDEQ